MDDIIKQIHEADKAGLYYVALMATLAIPDICGALSYADNRSTGARYKEWYENNVIPRYAFLTADECYKFRCSILHQGTTEPENGQRYKKIVFIEPIPRVPRPIATIKETYLNDGITLVQPIDFQYFLVEVTMAAAHWFEQNKELEPIKTNYTKMIKRNLNYPLAFADGRVVIG